MRNRDRETVFRFKQFEVTNRHSAMKVGTDGVLLGAWSLSGVINDETFASPGRILDVGCGTGLIALMMAQCLPNARISGIEIDPVAAKEAADNFRASPWSERLEIVEGDFNKLFSETGSNVFDLIVSNPPFFANGELPPDEARLTARHESTLSLESLLRISSGVIAGDGSLCLVLPADREEELKYQAVINHFSIARLTRVSTVPSKPPRRILVGLRRIAKVETQTMADSLSIHDGDGGFTDEYVSLVKDFYLNF